MEPRGIQLGSGFRLRDSVRQMAGFFEHID